MSDRAKVAQGDGGREMLPGAAVGRCREDAAGIAAGRRISWRVAGAEVVDGSSAAVDCVRVLAVRAMIESITLRTLLALVL